jgi:hypothetical protein
MFLHVANCLSLNEPLSPAESESSLITPTHARLPVVLIYHCVLYRSSVAEPHHFYAAPGETFDAAPATPAPDPAPAPTLLYSRSKFFKGVKGNIRSDIFFLLILCNENCSKYA